ncbi:MAG TPA: zinc ribbon domain-containing protein [Thermomonas sp.]|nr:zinc ribbon domain-containing protein [Thermomonas sp.]
MPIYAFTCDACGHQFDRLQRLSDADPVECPACGASGQVRRQLTAPQFRLAGGGWYETDFKKDGDKKRNLAEGGEGAKPAADPKPVAAQPAPAPVAKAEPAKPAAGGTPAG